MKQVYKLWYNQTPKKQSRVHKGYSISVEVDRMDAYYLNFMEHDNWYATTKAPQPVIDDLTNLVPLINAQRTGANILMADFTAKHSHFPLPRWTCLLDTQSNTAELIFTDWLNIDKRVTWTMFNETNPNRHHSHFYVDDYNKLDIQHGRKQAA